MVLAAGATVHSVTLNGARVAYHLVTTTCGTAVEVTVPRRAATELLAVEAGTVAAQSSFSPERTMVYAPIPVGP
jgi:hypothetical protein